MWVIGGQSHQKWVMKKKRLGTTDIDFTSNLMFGNLIYFIAFLAEVINKALTYKENSDRNIFEIISEAAGKRMGLSVNAEQLKSLI